MEIQELRIGNYYRWNSFKGEAEDEMTISQWNALDLMGFNSIYMDYMSHCFPVPLSKDWLEEFEFERFPWGLVKGDLLFTDDPSKPGEELTLQIANGFRVTVKYVHELQNLYYALKKEEL